MPASRAEPNVPIRAHSLRAVHRPPNRRSGQLSGRHEQTLPERDAARKTMPALITTRAPCVVATCLVLCVRGVGV